MKKFLFTIFLYSMIINSVLYSQVPIDSLIAKYPFNKNFKDESGNGNNGISHNIDLIPDRFNFEGRATNYNGLNGYVNIGKMDFLNENLENFSVSFWFKSDTINKNQFETIMKTINTPGAGTLFSIEVHRGKNSLFVPGLMRLDIRDEYDNYFTLSFVKPEIFDQNWHHIVFIIESSSNNIGNIYVDNEMLKNPILRAESPTFLEKFEYDLVFGAGNNRGNIQNYFKGSLDDIRFYNTSLTNIDVENLFYEGYCYQTLNDTIFYTDTLTAYETISVADTLKIDIKTIYEFDYYITTIKIYPNPTKRKLFIQVDNYENVEDLTVKIINILGVELFTSKLTGKITELNLSDLEGDGLYFIQILYNNDVVGIKKLVLYSS